MHHSNLPESGLTTTAVTTQLTKFGKNELVAARPVPLWRKIWQHMSDVSSLVLLFAVGLATYLALAQNGLDKDHCDWRHFSY
ncbi:cation-transporting P-type ATPase [Lactiplantibacillus plantarum]|uniref:cation-transporting P-type ATPase n=1 Tax=Lactiplantibacillus plantarum TaxID=1590 RepID=UPI001FBB5B40|nr:cation-transporting P-type ATPase [Lactiplantibacillus plantarum]